MHYSFPIVSHITQYPKSYLISASFPIDARSSICLKHLMVCNSECIQPCAFLASMHLAALADIIESPGGDLACVFPCHSYFSHSRSRAKGMAGHVIANEGLMRDQEQAPIGPKCWVLDTPPESGERNAIEKIDSCGNAQSCFR